jgi:tRNA pseudouridine65 synthase
MEEQQSGKTYHAVVRGWVHDAGVIDHPVRDKDEQGEPKEAMTKYSPLAQAELPFAVGRYSTARYTLLEVQPVTGRRHQIRKHLKHIAHPIVGDTTHGRGEHNRLFRDKFDCHRLLLQARSLAFRHPFTGEKVLLEAVDEPEWCRVLEHLGWNSLND